MSVAVNSVRNVVDAGYDIFGTQLIDSSQMVGKSTSLVNYIYQIYAQLGASSFSPQVAYVTYVAFFEDGASPSNYPENDGILLDHTLNTAIHASYTINNGFRHYHHQMQALKSAQVAGDFDPTSPSATAILGNIGGGNGILKQTNVSLGEMRGFKYQDNFTDFLPSSGLNAEHLEYAGGSAPISIGSTA